VILEAFFSTVASNVIIEIFKNAIDRKWKRLDEKDVERIVNSAIEKRGLVGQTSVIEREIIILLSNSGLVNAGGQLLLPPSRMLSELPELLGAWWDARVYKIVSVVSEKVLDVQDWRTDDGALIQQWEYYGSANQKWRVIPVGDNGQLFKIHSQQSNKVLDVRDWETDNGTPIQQWTYRGQPNQQWRLIPTDSNGEIFKIISEHSKKALDVRDWRTDDGAPIQQWDYHGDTNQQWRLMRVV